jgi:hypothetical protein
MVAVSVLKYTHFGVPVEPDVKVVLVASLRPFCILWNEE